MLPTCMEHNWYSWEPCPRCADEYQRALHEKAKQADRTANLARLKDAVVNAAITKVLALRVWKAAGGWNAPRSLLQQVDVADEGVTRAVDAYFAALRSETPDPDDGDPGIRWRKKS